MRRSVAIILAIAATLALSACGSSATSSGEDTATSPNATEAAATTKAKPKATKSDRIRECIEGVGYTVERPNNTMLRVKSPAGRMDAVILRFKTSARASRDAADGRADGLRDVAFGRYTVTFFNKAASPDSSESKVITDCVAS
jgi:FlaG/FlaF family flagellin (archaellin)